MTTRNPTAPQAQSPSQAIRTALAGMERVSAMLITVGQSLTDEAAEQRQTLTVIDQLLTDTHDDLERAEWAERAETAAQAEPTEHVPAADTSADTTGRAGSAAILAAVEAQRSLLINVASTIRCLKFSEEAGELGGPLELVEMELQRVLGGLEGPQLEMAASQGGES